MSEDNLTDAEYEEAKRNHEALKERTRKWLSFRPMARS